MIEDRVDLRTWPEAGDGRSEVQDEGSQLVALATRHRIPVFEATTFFSVRNPAPYAISIDIEYFRDSNSLGNPTYTDRARLGAKESRSFNLAAVEQVQTGFGWVGITAIDEFTGLPFAVQNLNGDFFQVDYGFDFATGDRLLIADEDLCTTWHSRFLSGGDFNGGTRTRFFVPQFDGEGWFATGQVYDEAGNLLQTIVFGSTQRTIDIPTAFLNLETNFGTIEWTFEDSVKGHIAVAMEALGRFSVGYGAACQD